MPVRRTTALVLAAATTAAVAGLALPAAAAGTSAVAGTAWADTNRNGVLDAGEQPWSGQVVYLYAADGSYLRNATTDATGAYRFGSLPDADYTVAFSPSSASAVQHDWVPTTTGSLQPSQAVHLVGAATADFGWRPITWSTSLGSPVTRTTTAGGTVVESFNDAVTAADVAAVLATGGLLGDEAAATTVRVGWGDVDQTVTSSTSSGGTFTGFTATSYVTWSSWLGNAPATVFHEYGHAWSLYLATMVQQDTSLSGYLQARGLTGDPRLGSSYAWNPREMVAEDYRQLFGNPAAQAQAQANPDVPPAAAVPGLADYLRTTFRTAPSSTTTGTTTSTVAAPVVSGLAMSPSPVQKSGTASFWLSTAASVTLSVQTPGGSLVRTLLSGPAQAGTVKATWNRTTSSGSRAKAGSYVLVATASNGGGSTQLSVAFSAS